MEAMSNLRIIPGKDKIGKDWYSIVKNKERGQAGKRNAGENLLNHMNLATWNIVCADKMGNNGSKSSKIFRSSFSGQDGINGQLWKIPITGFGIPVGRLFSPKLFTGYFLVMGNSLLRHCWPFPIIGIKKIIKTLQI
ncbi:hypothetical protein [Cyclobacterium plantarum]|nr:hypothetical protein [Cyclobacterium plantarum]